jgi:hypothetical protein
VHRRQTLIRKSVGELGSDPAVDLAVTFQDVVSEMHESGSTVVPAKAGPGGVRSRDTGFSPSRE